jgi:hypothetical protein
MVREAKAIWKFMRVEQLKGCGRKPEKAIRSVAPAPYSASDTCQSAYRLL